MTLWPKFDYVGAANAGIKDLTLGFIVSGADGQPSWGTYYSLTDPWVTSALADMHAAGISPTISFGGAANQDLSVTAANVAALLSDYKSVTNTYGIYKLDFDVEGAQQGNITAVTNQAQAIAALQAQDAAAGHPVQVSYTLPVLPTGLTADGLGVLQVAVNNGVNIGHVNIMAMDYGPGFDQSGNPGMGTYSIEAAQAVHTQLMQLYPSISSQQAWSMIDVTPMIGVNDDPSEVFTLADAHQLTTFAQQNGLGGVSMWSANRDYLGPVGVNSNTSSGVTQTTFEYSQIFEQVDS
jgi:hypothetical protein